MGVINGQAVSAEVTNPAFLDANADDTALGKISLNNISDPSVSGPGIINIQREFNALSSYTGKTININIAALPSWTNNQVGSPTDNLFLRSDALTATFDGLTGHTHDGTDGQGPNLPGSSIIAPFQGFFLEGTDLIGVTGSSTNVSTELTGKAPSTSQTILGVVVNTPYNKTVLRYASGTNENDQIFDSLGNIVYGRVTESAGVWTLSYFVLIGSVETAYSFASPTDVRWYYQELFNSLTTSPVYSQLAVIPSDNATADVLDATETQFGKVVYSNIAATSVGSLNVKGTSFKVSHEDHAHQGLHAVQEFTEAVNVFGDIVLKAGTGMTITRTGQTFLFDSTGSSSTPGGADTDVQFNDGGTFGGVSDFTFDKTTATLSVENKIIAGPFTTGSGTSQGEIWARISQFEDDGPGFFAVGAPGTTGRGLFGTKDEVSDTDPSATAVFLTGTITDSSFTKSTGYVRIQTGQNFGHGGTGQLVIITGSTTQEGNAGPITITAGSGNGTGNGGNLTLQGGNSQSALCGAINIQGGGTVDGTAGNIALTAGSSTNTAGAPIDLLTGEGFTGSGSMTLTTANAGDTGATTGFISHTTGASDGDTGDFFFTSGNSGSGSSGDWTYTPGTAPTGDQRGRFIVSSLRALFNAGVVNFFNSSADPTDLSTYLGGDVYFNTTINKLKVYSGTAWETITSV